MHSPDQYAPYRRFGAMVLTSTGVMFGRMHLKTYEADHVFFSRTRAWMAVVMGAAMALIMLGFMTHMLKNRALNVGILIGGVIAFGVALWLVRSS